MAVTMKDNGVGKTDGSGAIDRDKPVDRRVLS
jgi:hypothetical protein